MPVGVTTRGSLPGVAGKALRQWHKALWQFAQCHKPLRLLPQGAPTVPQDATAVATKCSHSATQHSLANERHDSVVAGSCSKSSWDLPLVEGPGRQVHPKTTTFCLVLGFTPSTQPSRAHQSQNDFEQRYSGTSVVLQGGLYALPDLVSPLPFPVLSFPSPFRSFRFSRRVTSGRKSASHALLAPDV